MHVDCGIFDMTFVVSQLEVILGDYLIYGKDMALKCRPKNGVRKMTILFVSSCHALMNRDAKLNSHDQSINCSCLKLNVNIFNYPAVSIRQNIDFFSE